MVVHNGLAPANELTLGVVKVWGAGSARIRSALLRDSTGKIHRLTLQHNQSTEVRGVWRCLATDVIHVVTSICFCAKQATVVWVMLGENN